MIISASRRTDIPAFFSGWLWKRLAAGTVRVRNPFRPSQIRTISLKPDDVRAFVFWTKNPQPMLAGLHQLDEYAYEFLFTLTAYGKTLEPRVPPESELLTVFRALSDRIGAHRVIWRYDPIILTNELTVDEHSRRFERLATALASFTNICIISFLSLYRKCQINLRSLDIIQPDEKIKKYLSRRFSEIAGSAGISLRACAEPLDLSSCGVLPAKCIDPNRIAGLTGQTLTVRKDPYQRENCGCVPSVDIGAYHTCLHGCLFCYANRHPNVADHYYQRFSFDQDRL